jgi:hypothetical protein
MNNVIERCMLELEALSGGPDSAPRGCARIRCRLAAGLYMGYWNQSRDHFQAAKLQPDNSQSKDKSFLKGKKLRTPNR